MIEVNLSLIGQKHIQFGILEWQRQDGSGYVFCIDDGNGNILGENGDTGIGDVYFFTFCTFYVGFGLAICVVVGMHRFLWLYSNAPRFRQTI